MNIRFYKRIVITMLALAAALCAFLFAWNLSVRDAAAVSYTTAKYLTNGRTTNGTTTSAGCPSNFKVYMRGASTSGTGTLSNGSLIDWSTVTIDVEPSEVSDHQSFQLLKDGSLYTSKKLSGNGKLQLYSGTLSDGDYELQYSCRYAPSFLVDFTYFFYTFQFKIDKTPPSYTLKAGGDTISSGSYTNEPIEYRATDEHFSYINYMRPGASGYTKYYSSAYTVGATDANNGRWYFYAVDTRTQSNSVVNVYLDTVKPVGKVTSTSGSVIANGGYTNSPVKYTATDTGGVARYEVKKAGASGWTSYTSGTSLSGTNGWYAFRATDLAGNISDEYKVFYDSAAPSGTLYGGNVLKTNGAYTNGEYVRYIATDGGSGIRQCYVKMPNNSLYVAYASGTPLMTEGEYTFYATDNAGNRSQDLTITLDRTKPVGTLYGGTDVLSDSANTNAEYVKYTASDAVTGVAALYVKKPNAAAFERYVQGTQLKEEGSYAFYCKDGAGNVSDTLSVTLDRTAPTGAMYLDSADSGNARYSNSGSVRYTASDGLSGLDALYVMRPNNGSFERYLSGTLFTAEGMYAFYAVDRAGNKSHTLTITLDRTKPIGTLYGGEQALESGGHTNAAYVKYDASDACGIAQMYVKLPSAEAYSVYERDAELTAEGEYSFYAVDVAGNKSDVLTITVDRQKPVGAIYADGIKAGDYTNAAHIWFESEETCFVKKPNEKEFEPYLSGVEYYKPGKYVFYAQSRAGTISEYYTVVIDRTQKPLTLQNVTEGKTDGDVVITWADGDLEQFAPITKVTVNGKPYVKDAALYTIDTGVYEIVCTDAAGNEWTAQFTSSKRNIPTQTLQKEYWEASDIGGEYFSFATYESAFNFAMERENSLVRTGEWKSERWDAGIAMDAKDSANAVNGRYFIYKKSGNPEEEVAYFTQERLNEVMAEYAAQGIESYFYWEKSPAAISDGENLYSYSDGRTILADSVLLGENIACTLNGEPFEGGVVQAEGRHILTVADEWGNTCEYILYVIRSAPQISYATDDGSENAVTFDRTYYFKDAVTVSIADAYDEMAMFNVYGEDGSLIGSFPLDERYTLDESGIYTVEAVNHFGKSQVFSLIISRSAPSVQMSENQEDKTLEVTISASADEQSHIKTVEIYKWDEVAEAWQPLTADDYGREISTETLVYRFRTSGRYRVVVTDEFRTGIDAVIAEAEYVQAVPDGVLTGVKNGGYTNGTVTFEWKDEATVTVSRDGQQIEYTSGQKLDKDGVYEIVFENFDGYRATYSFTIDTVAPNVVLNGVAQGGAVSGDVDVTFDEGEAAAELFRGDRSLGAYASGSAIAEDGAYKVVIKDLAGNETEVSFVIDKTVDFAIDVNDRGLSNGVTVTANEEILFTLTKDGEVVSYVLGEQIVEAGEYALTISDALGNERKLSFTIVGQLAQRFEHNFDSMPDFEKVLINGEERRLNYGTLELFEDGTYEVGVVAGGKTYTFTVTVDGTAPTLKLAGVENGGKTTGSVTVSEVSEDATLDIEKDGKAIKLRSGMTFSDVGAYKITLRDGAGNSTVYTFTIEQGVNGGLIALIVVAAVALAGLGACLLIRARKKAKNRSEEEEV